MTGILKGKRVVDPVLTTVARGYKNAEFIGDQLFQVVEMDKEGGVIPTFGKGVFAVMETRRAPGADSNILVREGMGTQDIVLDEHDLAYPVDYREQNESIIDEEKKAARRATAGIELRREVYAATLAQDKSLYTGRLKTLAQGQGWNADKSEPLKDIEAGIEAVRAATGNRPNVITMGASVMSLLRYHPAIQAAISNDASNKRITEQIIQDLLNVSKVLVGGAVSLDPKGKTLGDMWRDNLMIHYVAPQQADASSADEYEPSFGYTFRRKGAPVIDTYDSVGGKVKNIRYTDIYKVAVVGSEYGYMISNIKGA
ncbi:major capsid protein [Citrobacter portucalensis]|uniref:major capsid protein n=1 Tax=Citrobacter portucalensis TaxID=1639133 RepID=UPI00226B5072|nr:major capsid protein [Citrobacter portucalensis]MCX9038488.1 major capsid protein [Citrobacter portucalensis]